MGIFNRLINKAEPLAPAYPDFEEMFREVVKECSIAQIKQFTNPSFPDRIRNIARIILAERPR